MTLQRKSLFENADRRAKTKDVLDDLSTRFPVGDNKTHEHDRRELKEFSEEHGFPSREPAGRKNKKPRVKARRKLPQTGRNEQFNIRVHPIAKERFYDIADENRWGLGETLEHALDALEKQLRSETKG